MSLRTMPTAELEAEIKRREAEAAAEKRRILDAHQALIVEHIDVLLLFRPQHHGNCTDENRESWSWRECGRCLLLDIKRNQMIWPEDLEVDLEICRNETGWGP
jgi:hypothetical protein